ncbi:MAG: hypothetical protein QOG23_3859 [Blastocatellia bacterium]|jgi:hypothetical protein|nr:hypothetical protein [Blastocatellia bacterium]
MSSGCASWQLALPGSGTVCLPLPLGEGRGEGLVRQARNNSPGFSPFSIGATSQFFNAVDAGEEFLNGLRPEARSNVVDAVCAQALTPTLSKGRGSQTVPLRATPDF